VSNSTTQNVVSLQCAQVSADVTASLQTAHPSPTPALAIFKNKKLSNFKARRKHAKYYYH